MNDDTAVREMLHDLTLGQPDAPVDRMVGVRRRHVRRRSLQGATTVVTAAAAILGVLLGVGVLTDGTTEKPKSLQQPAKSWQLPWPDRSTPASSAIKTQALAHLRNLRSPLQVRDVHWLFAGDVGVTWAVFEATSGSNPGVNQLIALSSRDNGQTWVEDADVPPPPSTKQIGFGLPHDQSVLILAAPGVDQVALRDLSASAPQALTFADTSRFGVVSDRLESAPARDALLVGTPDLASTFVVRFPGGGHKLPKWQRDLVGHAPRIPGYRALSSESGDVASSSTNGTTVTEHHHLYSGPMLEIIRCAGQAPLTFSMTSGGQTSTQQIPRCDGQDVMLHLGNLGYDQQFKYTISGDPTAVYALAVYVQKAQ